MIQRARTNLKFGTPLGRVRVPENIARTAHERQHESLMSCALNTDPTLPLHASHGGVPLVRLLLGLLIPCLSLDLVLQSSREGRSERTG